MATLDQLKKKYLEARDFYYNSPDGKTLMSDAQFDALEDKIRAADPRWSGFKKTGAKIGKKTKVKLRVPMGSLDKVKAPTVQRWLDTVDTSNAVVSDKLDGSSLELRYEGGAPVRLVTRGDGKVGGDVSFLIPHLKNVPAKVGTASFTLRTEGLFSHSAFLKYKAEFDSARNAASGILNRQDAHRALKDLSVVVLQVVEPNMQPSKGLAWAKAKGFQVVPHKVVPFKKLNPNNLSVLLNTRKAKSKYALDGIVITEDKVNVLPRSGNPDWARAFKENVSTESAPVTTVLKVHWKVSSHGVLAPTVQYKPVEWEGAQLEYASAFNAKFVNDNGIGKGARIAILRSGDIIPYIVKVLKQVQPDKPSVAEFGAYALDKKGTQYVLTNPLDNDDFRIQKITRFFANIDVDYMREQTVRRLYASGFTNIKKITHATAADFARVPGFKAATAEKLAKAIRSKIDAGIPLVTLMDASGVFPRGMGTTRFDSIAQKFDLLKLCAMPEEDQVAKLVTISGFKETTARFFTRGSRKFLKWTDIVGIYPMKAKAKKVKTTSQKLAGKGISWTGYRNKDEEQVVGENGGQVVPFGSRTSVLLFKPGGKESTKIGKATQKGIPVMTWTQFAKKYGL